MLGKGPGFCNAFDEMGEIFVVDVHSDFHVYLQKLKPYLPKEKTKRGRPAIKYQTDQKRVEVLGVVRSFPRNHWRRVTLRNTPRGELKVLYCRLEVYVWDGESDKARCWQLIDTQSLGKNEDLKISLTNASQCTPLKRLGWMQRQRHWIERVFEDAKSKCGMADYQVRNRSAWHHHMALVMVAMQFMLTERIRHKDTYPLLSCADIEELLAHFLPRCGVSEEEVILQLENRHRQREMAIKSHSRIQNDTVNWKALHLKFTKSN